MIELSDDLIDMSDPAAVMSAPWGEENAFPSLPSSSAAKEVVGGTKASVNPIKSATSHRIPSMVPENPLSPHSNKAPQLKGFSAAALPAVSAWSKPKPTTDSHTLNPVSTSSATLPPAASAWGTSNITSAAKLFPNAPAAVAPSPEVLQGLLTAAERKPVYAEHDPTNPSFNPARYYCQYAQGYRCPNKVGSSAKKCVKVRKNVQAFIAHLKSPIHMDLQEVACPHCLRPFLSSTAVTQHFESQAIRCNARKLGHADILVQDLTQILSLSGQQFADDTNQYINDPDVTAGIRGVPVAQNAIDFNRRTVDDKVEADRKKAEARFHEGKW